MSTAGIVSADKLRRTHLDVAIEGTVLRHVREAIAQCSIAKHTGRDEWIARILVTTEHGMSQQRMQGRVGAALMLLGYQVFKYPQPEHHMYMIVRCAQSEVVNPQQPTEPAPHDVITAVRQALNNEAHDANERRARNDIQAKKQGRIGKVAPMAAPTVLGGSLDDAMRRLREMN